MPTSSTAFKRVAVALAAAACTSAGAAHAADCWTTAGEEFGIDPLLLYSIAKVESSMNPSALNRNRDGTVDIGLMQINSTHLPELMKVGMTQQRLMHEPCSAIHAGAEILAGFIGRYGYTWEAVGAYNAGTAPERQSLRQAYASKVWAEYRQLTLARARNQAKRRTAAGG